MYRVFTVIKTNSTQKLNAASSCRTQNPRKLQVPAGSPIHRSNKYINKYSSLCKNSHFPRIELVVIKTTGGSVRNQQLHEAQDQQAERKATRSALQCRFLCSEDREYSFRFQQRRRVEAGSASSERQKLIVNSEKSKSF